MSVGFKAEWLHMFGFYMVCVYVLIDHKRRIKNPRHKILLEHAIERSIFISRASSKFIKSGFSSCMLPPSWW